MKGKSVFSYVLVFIIFLLAYWGVTYTADGKGYEMFFQGKLESRDKGFEFLALLFDNLGYGYSYLYRFHIVCMALFYILFLKCVKSPPYILIAFLIVNYVALGNQIRFYVALPLSYIALYELGVKRKYISYLLLSGLSIMFHSTLIILHGCVLLYCFIINRRFSKRTVIMVLLSNMFIWLILHKGLSVAEQYGSYLSKDGASSTGGGVYNLVPSLIAFLVIYALKRQLQSCSNYDATLRFIYVLSFSTSMLLLISIHVQIFANRFISSCFLVWLTYCISAKVYLPKSKKYLANLATVSIVIVFFLWSYIMPYLMGLTPHSLIEAGLMLESYEF